MCQQTESILTDMREAIFNKMTCFQSRQSIDSFLNSLLVGFEEAAINKLCLTNVPDPFNKTTGRGVTNTNPLEYNCMGFAFQTFTWLQPYLTFLVKENSDNNTIEFENLIKSETITSFNNFLKSDLGRSTVQIVDELSNDSVIDTVIENISYFFPHIRVISNTAQLNDNEYGITLMNNEYSFHFIVYEPNYEIYFDKRGETMPRALDCADLTIIKMRYDKRAVMFAMEGDFYPTAKAILNGEVSNENY